LSTVQSLLLVALQGVAEFLPISSSGHLVLLRNVMTLGDIPLLYDVLLHVSTLIVVAIVFRKKILSILASIWRWLARSTAPEDRENLKLTLYILVATVVTGAVGLLLSSFEDFFFRQPRLVSLFFFITALILISTLLGRGRRDYLQMGVFGALIVGLAQGIGVLPGISRAGITISVALLWGLDRQRAGEFSFLIAIPAILGALLLQLREAGSLLNAVDPAALALGFAASFVVGLISLLLLLTVVRKGRLALFSIYLVPLAVVTFILL
jgi:undecaprenyl-diphosphatase